MEAIGTLAGGIAHDFNNILSAIIGYTELVLNDVSRDSQMYSDLQEVLKAGRRAGELVSQILTFSRQREKEKKPIQIVSIMKEAIKLMRASLPSTIEFRQNIESNLGNVLGDPTQIHQMLMNLCTNAGHAMREKGGILDVRLTAVEIGSESLIPHMSMVPGSYVRLSVSDTGSGISENVLERIFEPYFTTKDMGEGTGLGLATVHGIVESHGGTITVDSEVGKGSAFTVYFPIIKGEHITELDTAELIQTGNECILLVDDERELVEMEKRILESLGYSVTSRVSSIEALELFRAKPDQFDLVITDQTMPNMTGDKLTGELRRIRPDIPVILCTGYSELISSERAKALGISKFLMKPLNMIALSDAIREILKQ